ncbi:MAG: NAD(P)-binding domain-containing protein [Flavisolibacter sp.]
MHYIWTKKLSMRIGVLGTGSVGEAIASELIKKGHSVQMGSRSVDNEKSTAWVEKMANEKASKGNFSQTAQYGELIFLCLSGSYTLDVIETIDPENFSGKIIIDTTNPLDFSKGMPPDILKEFSSVSLGESVQRKLPAALVVKTLNTVNYKLMVNARLVNNGDHHLFLCGDNAKAKQEVKNFLSDNFYWKIDHFVDLGGIASAKTVEAIVPFWVSVWKSLETPLFNFKIVQ